MVKNFQIAIGIVLAAAALAPAQSRINDAANKPPQGGQVTQLQQTDKRVQSPWVVSVVHKVDSHKLIEHLRKEQNLSRVGVPGSLPEFFFNITTGAVIDDKGHVVTRLATLLDPQNKEQNISVITSEGVTIPAKFIGLDCASGFTVLEVPNLNVKLPDVIGNISIDKFVKILSVDLVQKTAINDNRQGVYVAPEIKMSSGRVEASNIYAKERGVWMLRSASLRSKNDSAVVMTTDNQLLGLAKYAGFGRADLFPIEMIRDLIARRVIDKNASIPAAWLGVVGVNVFQLSPEAVKAFAVVNTKAGVVVDEVTLDSPASQSGIKRGDVIIGLDEFPINSTGDLGALLSTMPAGRKIKLKVLRQQQALEITVALGARPYTEPVFALQFEPAVESGPAQLDDLHRRAEELKTQYRTYANEPHTPENIEILRELNIEIREIYDQIYVAEQMVRTKEENLKADQVSKEPIICTLPAGFTVSEMTKQFADWAGTPKGLFVKSVVPGSTAELAGIKAADVIVGATQEPLTCAQLQTALSKTSEALTLKVIRNKQPLSISLNSKR